MNNCYGYALDIDSELFPGTNCGKDSPTEEWSNITQITAARVKELMDACLDDGLDELPIGNCRKIAVFIHRYADCIDFHFYRLDGPDWSHRPCAGAPVQVAKDPRTSDAMLVGHLDPRGEKILGQQFCGFLYAPVPFTWSSD
jgi:hypothetical protein